MGALLKLNFDSCVKEKSLLLSSFLSSSSLSSSSSSLLLLLLYNYRNFDVTDRDLEIEKGQAGLP